MKNLIRLLVILAVAAALFWAVSWLNAFQYKALDQDIQALYMKWSLEAVQMQAAGEYDDAKRTDHVAGLINQLGYYAERNELEHKSRNRIIKMLTHFMNQTKTPEEWQSLVSTTAALKLNV